MLFPFFLQMFVSRISKPMGLSRGLSIEPRAGYSYWFFFGFPSVSLA